MFSFHHIYYHLNNLFSASFTFLFYERTGIPRVAPEHSKLFVFIAFLKCIWHHRHCLPSLHLHFHDTCWDAETNILKSPQVRDAVVPGSVLGVEYPALPKTSELIKHTFQGRHATNPLPTSVDLLIISYRCPFISIFNLLSLYLNFHYLPVLQLK